MSICISLDFGGKTSLKMCLVFRRMSSWNTGMFCLRLGEKKKRILTVSQRNTNISIQQSETLEIAGGERHLQVQSHKKESITAGEAERQPGRFLHRSKQRSAVRQTHSQDRPSTPPGTRSASSLEQSLDPRWMEQPHMSVCASARLFPLMLGLSTGFFAGQMQRSHVWRALRRYFQAG